MTTESYLKPVSLICLPSLCKDQFIGKRFVKINELTPNQKTLDADCLNRKLKGISKFSQIFVLNFKGLNILIDGHHTVIAKKLKGQTKVLVNYLELK